MASRIRSPSPLNIISEANQNLIDQLPRYAHPGPPFVKNQSDGRLCIPTPIKDANRNKGKAKYVQFLLNDSTPRAFLTMGRGHPVYAVKLQARPRDGAQSLFHPFRQRLFKCNQPYQHLVNRALQTLGDPFIEGEVRQFRQLTQELQEARQEAVDAHAEVCHAQQVEMLATSTLAIARQAVDTLAERFEQAAAYRALHTHLVRQSFRHVSDDTAMVDVRDLLHCQLQARGRPTSPDSDHQQSSDDIDNLLACFDDTPVSDHHADTFIQDGGNDDGY